MKIKQKMEFYLLALRQSIKRWQVLIPIFLCMSWIANGQINIQGHVTDETNESLIGVNVQVKGTSKGTATDFSGDFTLESIDPQSVLIFSYIGYQTQEVAVAGKSVLNVTLLTDAKTLDEVVVTALGIRKESKALGYSVTKLDGEEFTKVRQDNFAN